MRHFLMLSACVTALLGFAACNIHDPSPMPRGYSSYNKAFKSAPGVPARDVGYEYSQEANQAVLDAMRPAATDLANQLDEKLSFDVDKIYLKPSAQTAFYMSLDHLLRDEITKRGYMLSVSPEDAVSVLIYADKNVPECQNGSVYVALAMNVVDKTPEDVVGGYYNIPQYDFVPVNKLKLPNVKCKG